MKKLARESVCEIGIANGPPAETCGARIVEQRSDSIEIRNPQFRGGRQTPGATQRICNQSARTTCRRSYIHQFRSKEAVARRCRHYKSRCSIERRKSNPHRWADM